MFIFEIRSGNSLEECTHGCKGSKYRKASCDFCDCIYNQGKPPDCCLKEYKQAQMRMDKMLATFITSIQDRQQKMD